MSDVNDHIDNDDDGADEFIAGLQEAYENMSEEERFEAFAETALDNVELEEAVEDATEVVKALTEAGEEREERFQELAKSASAAADLIEKMRGAGKTGDEDASLIGDIRKSLGGADLDPAVEARITELEKSNNEAAIEKAVTKAKTYGFGDPKVVAALETGIRKSLGNEKADQFVAIVKQAGGLAKVSPVFKSIGEDAGNADSTSPIAKAKASVSDIKKANPGFTDAQALTHYWTNNPEEYAAHQAARASAA